jgi:acyl-CoA thioesterase FadM
MNLWLRLLLLLACSPFRPRLADPLGISRLRLRVWLNDLDINGHMNNGRYWTIFDLGRIDLILRTGLSRVARKKGWLPVMRSGAIRFRRELRLFQPFVLETKLLAWTGTRLIIEQRVLTGSDSGVVATRALVLAGFYCRRERGFVPANTLLGSMGLDDINSPALDSAAQALIGVDASLKEDCETSSTSSPA